MEDILARLDALERRLAVLEGQTPKLSELEEKVTKQELIKVEASTDLIRTEVSAMGKALAKQIRTQINSDVVDFLNKEVAPKVNDALAYVAIQTENPEESVSDYRDEVQGSYTKRTNHAGLLEHSGSRSGNDSVYISPWVSINYK